MPNNKYIVTLQHEVETLDKAQELRLIYERGSPGATVSVSLWDEDGLCMGLIAHPNTTKTTEIPRVVIPAEPVLPMLARRVKSALASGKIGPLFLHDELRFTGQVYSSVAEHAEALNAELKPYTWDEIQGAKLALDRMRLHDAAEQPAAIEEHAGEHEPTVTMDVPALWAELQARDAARPRCNGTNPKSRWANGAARPCIPGDGCLLPGCPDK